MAKKEYVIDRKFRMKVVNFLKLYGYYNGVLVKNGMDKKYVNGEILIGDIIRSKNDYKELKMSINKVLDYCYKNCFDEIEGVMNYFYKVECAGIRQKYGSFFDRH